MPDRTVLVVVVDRRFEGQIIDEFEGATIERLGIPPNTALVFLWNFGQGLQGFRKIARSMDLHWRSGDLNVFSFRSHACAGVARARTETINEGRRSRRGVSL